MAAFQHHFADQQLDSLAINVEPDPEEQPPVLTERLLRVAAVGLGLPAARVSETLWCAEEITYPRRCELEGTRHLVSFGLSDLSDDRAVVWVTTWSEWEQGRVDGAGTQYELRRSSTSGWTVVKELLHSAT